MKDREDTGQGLQAGAVPPKPRKAYVLTKTRESWSEEEHGRFVEALRLYARDWKRIEEHVGTKSATQIRSHAQKHFHKAVQQGEEIPPPRAKRRSAAPTPRLRPLPQQQQQQQQQGTHAPQRQPSHRQQQQQQQQQHKRQLLLQSLRPLSSSPASAGQRACASTSAADEVRSLACTQHIPWVETGDTVSKQYADARSEARDWCRLRNHCFQQATLAYCNGNKALAKELSIKGRSAADKMWEAHASAADTILATRNAKHREKRASLYQISCGAHPHFVDLHGLHVQEALAVIAQYLEEGTSTPAGGHKGNVLRVCVGTGHHTMGPTANAPRLAAAVMNALREWGVRYRVLQPGLLEVLL
uniref:Smr domain-containing protein n=1 Tax=Dunaliella tertiolecta TaxID=3047 RepID=A0A7S3QV60_DUNTE